MGSREFPLDDVRADGWFERLGEGAPHFLDLCEVLSERTVAFAVVAMLAAVVFSALIGWTLLTRRKPAEDGDAA